jgi:pyruvate formate lyase activating enzyme
LSVGSYGCNLRCPFCQNCEISMADGEQIETVEVSPAALVGKALELLPRGNIGIAYTYNEPLVGYEYVRDCAKLAKEHSLKNVVVTNGNINEKPLQALLPDIDAMNIDLKGFTERFYTAIGGNLETVKRSIQIAAERCHVEVTTLVIPGENDSVEEMDALSRWLAGVSPEIPLHVSRFFPRWRMTDRGPTPVETIDCLAETARKNLRYVYKGNC